jgi:hypothetical protein
MWLGGPQGLAHPRRADHQAKPGNADMATNLDGSPVFALSTNGCQVALKHSHIDALLDESYCQHKATDTRPSNEHLQGPLLSACITGLCCSVCNQGCNTLALTLIHARITRRTANAQLLCGHARGPMLQYW